MSTLEFLWPAPPETLILGEDEAHVWAAPLDLPAAQVEALERLLADEERNRAERFLVESARRRFIVARGRLRLILGRYLARDPVSLAFSYNPYGKPALAEDVEGAGVSFNLAHSHEMALFAITRSRAIGVDLERRQMDGDLKQLAERLFSPAEVRALRSMPVEMYSAAFFTCWTRKEAYVKARGLGLSLDLKLFDVTVAPETPAALLNSREAGQDAAAWSLFDLGGGSEYAAALAVRGHVSTVTRWRWP